MKVLRAVWGSTFANPLIQWRLQRGTAYNLVNLLLLLFIIAAVFLAWVRWDEYIERQEYIAALPPELQASEKAAVLPNEPEMRFNKYGLKYETAVREGAYEHSYRDELAVRGQRSILNLFILFLFLRVLLNSWRRNRRFGNLEDENIRLTSTSFAQRLVAFHDWPMIKYFVVLIFLLALLLLPSRVISYEEFFFATHWSPWTVILEFLFMGAIALYLHRILQIYFVVRHKAKARLGKSRMWVLIYSTLILILASVILPGAASFYLSKIQENASDPFRDSIMYTGYVAGILIMLWFVITAVPEMQKKIEAEE